MPEQTDRPDMVHMASLARDADEIARVHQDSLSAGDGVIKSALVPLVRIFALSMVALSILFLVNAYLSFVQGWPGLPTLFGHLGWFGAEALQKPLDGGAVTLGWVQLGLYVLALAERERI